MASLIEKLDPRELSATDVLRSGTVAGLAMIPVGAAFRFFGLRVNEYGRKMLELVLGEVAPPAHVLLMFLQHMMISIAAAVPLLLLLKAAPARVPKIWIGLAYGALFYIAVNSLALPIAFGDPTPWQLGASVILPSFIVHLVYGTVVAAMARGGGRE